MTSEDTKSLILKYWNSWQKKDWQAMRECLAETIVFGGNPMPSEQLVVMSENGTPWKNVTMIDSQFSANKGSILYEGTNTLTGKVIRVAEFITIENGKIVTANACFGSGMPPID